MNMSVYERRIYLSHLLNEKTKTNEAIEAEKEKLNNKGAKGSRTTRVSGSALKEGLKNGVY
jgi:coenzyme F420-reducing hydrogenase beta subunit